MPIEQSEGELCLLQVPANSELVYAVSALHLHEQAYVCRDYADDPSVQTLPFTADLAAFKTIVGSIAATGGGDAAEDVFSGLQAVAQLDWQAGSRVLVHVADCPCHGFAYHNWPEASLLGQHSIA